MSDKGEEKPAGDGGFYRAFEDKHRGPRELITSRLRAYLPFVDPLKSIDARPSATDLGCGRGEWLELLGTAGFDAQGVDLDAGMLAACYAIGLRVTKGDAIGFLKSLPDASQMVVSGFHIAEHLPFAVLQTLVLESLRVLKPGGLLILETPNPENPVVAGCKFYLDPTHQRPLPPALLYFLPEHYGFARIKILRLQESTEVPKFPEMRLRNVLEGVSEDYAIVAQKGADDAVMAATGNAFNADYGVTLQELAGRFDDQTATRAAEVSKKLAAQGAEIARLGQRLAEFESRSNSGAASPLRLIRQKILSWFALKPDDLREKREKS